METPAVGVGFRISLVQCRHRLLDAHDSMPFSLKATVDEITRFIGYTADNDPRLHWEYSQTLTKGPEGVLVRIEVL